MQKKTSRVLSTTRQKGGGRSNDCLIRLGVTLLKEPGEFCEILPVSTKFMMRHEMHSITLTEDFQETGRFCLGKIQYVQGTLRG
jgi:hypothetical protein